jgi:hypothetical protein
MTTLELLEQRIARTASFHHLAGIGGMALGVGLVAFGGYRLFALWMAFGFVFALRFLLMVGFGAFLFRECWQQFKLAQSLQPARSSAIYRMLSDGNALSLLWAHVTTGRGEALKLHFADGTSLRISTDDRSESETLLQLVAERAPHVLLGFGVEQRAKYQAIVDASRSRPSSGAL